MKSFAIPFLTLVVVLFPTFIRAQTSFPMITHTTPVAVQRGKSTEVVVNGRMNFHGTYKALFAGTGIKAEVVTKPAKKKAGKTPQVSRIKLKLTVAANAALGVREFRFASTLGISSIGQLVIVDDPVVTESKANNTLAQAQSLNLSSVATGRLEAKEDVDFYKFHADKGDQLTFEVWCARLQDKIHDLQKHAKPMLVLYDSDGRELAANDHFYFADPLLGYTIAKSGTYYVQIRESTYDGDARWVYALLVSKRPYASHIYPMAACPGQTLKVEPVGSARAFKTQIEVTAPRQSGIQRVPLPVGGDMTNPITLVVSDLAQVLEKEANDMPGQATPITLPCGINGRLGQRRDLDHFVFHAKKGKAIHFQAYARRFGTVLMSSAHIVMEVMNTKGTVLASATETHSLTEAAVTFTPRADGEYILRVRDLNSKGGPTAVYYVAADWARPDFAVQCDPDKAMIGPGSSTAWFVKIERKNGFQGSVKIAVDNLPKAVTCSELTIAPNMTEGVLVLTAAPNAKHDVSQVDIVGTAVIKNAGGKETTLARRAQSMEEIYSPGGGRALFPVGMQTIAITEPSDIVEVQVKPQKITLRPGQEVKLEVTLKRHSRYQKNVSLNILLKHLNRTYGNPLPPGVTIVGGKSKTLLGKGSKGHIVLKAAANAAPIDNVPIAVLAHVSINFVVKVSYSSQPIWIAVTKKN